MSVASSDNEESQVPYTIEELQEIGRKCKALAEDSRAKRPRAQFVAPEDIPLKLRRLQKIDLQRSCRTPRSHRIRGTFSKHLKDSRPKLPSSSSRADYKRAIESGSSSSESEIEMSDDDDEDTYEQRLQTLSSHESSTDFILVDGLRVKQLVVDKLFEHQVEGVKWMWQLHRQETGGILGDEMGLGKTAQVISLLGGLHYSSLYRPSLVICPVTLLRHWLDELREWYPWIRACILHDSFSKTPGSTSHNKVINDVVQSLNGLLITTYEHFRIYCDELLPIEWGYVVLDEGHKIKNPDAEITLLVKQVRTRRRLILTGSPVQNKLTELWSLFDFVFPGKLGTLPVFEMEFGVPIQVGGYKNASRLSVITAIKCAAILRDMILPYILIRHKAQVNLHLPEKKEHILFCKLSEEQTRLYKEYINSAEVQSIIRGRQRVLAGIDILRKICNHPDLLQEDPDQVQGYGNADRSDKLQVTLKILKEWKERGDKVLVFTQTQLMLDILEDHLQKLGYLYHRMDGNTPIISRDKYMKSFNCDEKIFAFLLTTRVGGLGVNLTGANRVLLYDPDWNPSIDVQARERAWRIGQGREVTVYRLITVGTIEEKIYQRQMFKQFLKDKVLKDVTQKRMFSSKRIRDLFTLDEEKDSQQTETEKLLEGMKTEKSGDPILESILGDGVKSVLDQKMVEASAETEKKDAVSYEASQMAKEALFRMQTAGEKRSEFKIHFPTWTGRNGSAGAPPCFNRANEFGFRVLKQTPKAGTKAMTAPSSVTLLSKMQSRRRTIENEISQDLSPRTESCALPSKPLPQSKPPPIKHHVNRNTKWNNGSDGVNDVPREDFVKWKQIIVNFFKQRGRVVNSEILNSGLASQIKPEKHELFKKVVLRLARKLPNVDRWVLDANI